ncbi:MAG: methyltransferase domain-containing protein [Rhodobacteraceae bacterium]|nr:methyltransferase domain-containing protein [Paracoccaceae bacterium]
MHLDVLELRSFYYTTRLGRFVQRSVRGEVERLWPAPAVRGQTVAGFGFAAPLLRPFLTRARRVIALMPDQQGVMPWPGEMPNHSVLCEETLWPLPDGLVDRLVVLHGLETCENPTRLLEECWRVLAPGGRALFVVPNRSGLWARRDATPFGNGRPYSMGQLEGLLEASQFETTRHVGALFAPPNAAPFWMRTAPAWERVGRHLPWGLAAGVLLVEAAKRTQPHRPRGLPEAVLRPLEALEGIAGEAPKPTPGRARGA